MFLPFVFYGVLAISYCERIQIKYECKETFSVRSGHGRSYSLVDGSYNYNNRRNDNLVDLYISVAYIFLATTCFNSSEEAKSLDCNFNEDVL